MVFRAIGNATLQTAEKSGIAKNVVQPPYPCALPLPEIESIHDRINVESILDFTFESVLDMLDDDLPRLNASVTDPKLNKPWKSVSYKDKAPGGDLVLQSRPHVGAYNFARAMMTFRGVPPEVILHYMHSYNLDMRQKYSDNISAYNIVCWNPNLPSELCFDGVGNDKFHLPELAEMGIRDWHVEYNEYSAPPPVATRDMVYLVEKRYVPETKRYYIYGTSVDLHGYEKRVTKCVRGHVLFGWEYETLPNGDTKARYISCMNPNGWTPTFIIGWLKSAIGKELTGSRDMLYEILRQNAKLGDTNSSSLSSLIKQKPLITVNSLSSPVATKPRAATPLTSAPQNEVDVEDESSPFGSPPRRPGLSLHTPRDSDRSVETVNNASLCTPFSCASLRDDSFSFLSRGPSTMVETDDDDDDERGATTRQLHHEDARRCDDEEEELCV